MDGVSQNVQSAYAEYDRQTAIGHFRIACLLGFILMPAGTLLDRYVYPDFADEFLKLRFLSSGLIAVFYAALLTHVGRKFYRAQGVMLFMIPAFFISWMIYKTDGSDSPYYAGLILVLLVLAFVLNWTFRESLSAVTLVLLLYGAMCWAHGGVKDARMFVNNVYFITLTGIIVATGSYFHSKLRFREFASRYELDLSQKQLKTSNEALSQKKEELESANTQLSQNKAELEHALVELRQTQDQLVTKEKQASLGVWSAGIIHEMNNPLNFARTGLYALRNKEKHLPTEQQPDFKDLVADIEDGIKRVHMIVSDLRTYAHPGKEDDHEEVPVEEALRVALRFFSADLQGRVEIIKQIPSGMLVFVNRNKLIQVLGNLLQNSIDALKLKTFPEGEHPVITISGTQSNVRSNITIRDNGTGIKKEDLGKIFDPFFTTKDVGQGMGLGLGICYRIVQGFGGTISVRSEPGEFCEFTLDLPAERPDAAAN
jgi:two-component system sensor histidine kinase PhcS